MFYGSTTLTGMMPVARLRGREREICVFRGRSDIIACHCGTSEPTHAGHSPVTVGVFAYCPISDAVFQECAFGVNQKLFLTVARTI